MTIENSIKALGPWFHQIDIQGHFTRDIAPSSGPQPRNHPWERWAAIRDHLPDLNGRRVLDLGCADGFFSIELARLGANVSAVDGAGRMVKRLRWAAKKLGVDVNARVGTVEEISGSYDFILFIGVLYHLKNPLLGLERVAALADNMLIETTVAEGEEPYLWFKPPQEGVHHIPKWFPTLSCLEAMLRFVGYSDIRPLPYGSHSRAMYLCRK